MKICGIICEFNPFHNGHKYLLDKARELSKCDYLLCIMSGNFTQRGDICIVDKYKRAEHAVLAGADCVIELPASFAVAPAEIFARGAIKILSAIPNLCTIAFGSELPDKDVILSSARILSEENVQFKIILNDGLKRGESFIKSYQAAFEQSGGVKNFLSSPNNVLAVEYAKSILKNHSDIEILPIKRIGAGFNDGELKEGFSSASAIRKNLSSPLLKTNVPDFVINDLKEFTKEQQLYESFLTLILSRTDADILKNVYGCTEGLENALKSLESENFDEIIAKLTTTRYTSSRIKRILLANFLQLYRQDCEQYLNSNLYFTPLAVKNSCADALFSNFAVSDYPLITSGNDLLKLCEPAKTCKKSDDFAYRQWQQITGLYSKDKLIII